MRPEGILKIRLRNDKSSACDAKMDEFTMNTSSTGRFLGVRRTPNQRRSRPSPGKAPLRTPPPSDFRQNKEWNATVSDLVRCELQC